VYIFNLFPILDLFPNRTSGTCKIQLSRLNRILWSHRWWKVVPSQKFVSIIIRNSRTIQLYHVSQILLASSSGLMGVSCLQDPLFEVWWFRCVISHVYTSYLWISQKFWKLEIKLKFGGFQNFQKIELKILSIRIIRIIRKKSLIRIIRIFGQRINSRTGADRCTRVSTLGSGKTIVGSVYRK